MCISSVKTNGFNKQLSCKINGVETEIVFHAFANKWFLLITQYGRVPNMYSVQFDLKRNDGAPLAVQGPINHPQFHMSVPITITCNFGADRDETRSGVQFLVNRSKLNNCPHEFMIGLGIKELNGETLHEIAKVLDEVIA
ncbi:uncharacterized protein LOC101893873 [Musca domestica]|uniref:Uncharacterized protein LOC101893873 n=1 Tax=Musca domestica TaxID=7370 RepID=A0A1I8NCB2_MUSDO|nr:uncharacterized protein LOC101893873 [Musca domestica]